jgi:hypothetical protein
MSEQPAVTVGALQDGLRGQLARIYQPDGGLVIDDSLVPAEFTDGVLARHGDYVVIIDDEPNIFGALRVHRPGHPDDNLILQHFQLAVPVEG